MDKWAELRTAYQVAKLGTVSAAADALGFHRATVNRHIDVLEKEVGARIFLRHARGYSLTELGEDVLRVAQKTEELIDDMARRAQGGKIEGEIKLTTLASFAPLLMQPIALFRAQNPQCRVDIDASDDLAKLEYGKAHIALRIGAKPDHPDYVASSFGQLRLNLYAHESYINRHGLPKGPDDFEKHLFVMPLDQSESVPFLSWIREHVKPEQVAVSSSHVGVNVEAICSGAGIGFMADFEATKRSNLHRVLSPQESWSSPLWLLAHVDLYRTEKVQAMLECIKASRANMI